MIIAFVDIRDWIHVEQKYSHIFSAKSMLRYAGGIFEREIGEVRRIRLKIYSTVGAMRGKFENGDKLRQQTRL